MFLLLLSPLRDGIHAWDFAGARTDNPNYQRDAGKWTWAATLLQSSNVAYKFGVAGPFWYAAGELAWRSDLDITQPLCPLRYIAPTCTLLTCSKMTR
jgi:hypothetical protein